MTALNEVHSITYFKRKMSFWYFGSQTQRRDRASGVPLEILEHIPPKPESAYFLLVLSPKPLTLRGALPHYLSLKKELAYSSS